MGFELEMKRRGLFITFEGMEGSGKSTQIKRAASFLKSRGFQVSLLREPGGTRISESIRNIILNQRFREMTPETELLLYLAARAQLVREVILPALKRGRMVICDRFEDSTLAYQGFARRLSLRAIDEINRSVVRGSLKPDLTILLDVRMREGIRRAGRDDRIEREPLSFHERVRRGFLTIARKNRKRYVIIDGHLSRAEIARQVRETLHQFLRKG